MKDFQFSKKSQLSKNVFAFKKDDKVILFNRINFRRLYLENNPSLVLLKKKVKSIDEKTSFPSFYPPPLKKIRVEVTLRCNCRCDYCLVYKNSLNQINLAMDKITAKKIISFYKENVKNGSLMLIGAEPLLNWPIVKLFIKNIKDPIKIFTNGTIINKDILNTLKKNQNVRLMISLDGKKVDNKGRKFQNGKEIFSIVIKNIRIFQKNNCNLGIACLCTNKNVGHLIKIVKFFVDTLGIKNLGISFPHYIFQDLNKIDLNMKKYTTEMMKIFDFALKKKVYIDQLAKRFSPLVNKKFRFYACKLVGEEKTFYPDGSETFCTKIDSLSKPEKYNLEYFKNVISINNKFCRNCPAIGICGGGCFWDGIMRFKNGVDERECVLNNKLLEYFLWRIYAAEKKRVSLDKEFESLIIK